ncbi:MAG: hypothetical protein R3E48_02915 [Burkholderiaceae bacterium]
MLIEGRATQPACWVSSDSASNADRAATAPSDAAREQRHQQRVGQHQAQHRQIGRDPVGQRQRQREQQQGHGEHPDDRDDQASPIRPDAACPAQPLPSVA